LTLISGNLPPVHLHPVLVLALDVEDLLALVRPRDRLEVDLLRPLPFHEEALFGLHLSQDQLALDERHRVRLERGARLRHRVDQTDGDRVVSIGRGRSGGSDGRGEHERLHFSSATIFSR
jgi:hypothetical protein